MRSVPDGTETAFGETRISRLVLWLSVATFAGFGLAFWMRPGGMAGLVQIGLPTATARTDFAATYGGLELGIAAFLAWCALRRGLLAAGLVASGLLLAGMAAVRLVGILTAGGVLPLLYLLLAAELSGTALSFWAASRARAADPLAR